MSLLRTYEPQSLCSPQYWKHRVLNTGKGRQQTIPDICARLVGIGDRTVEDLHTRLKRSEVSQFKPLLTTAPKSSKPYRHLMSLGDTYLEDSSYESSPQPLAGVGV